MARIASEGRSTLDDGDGSGVGDALEEEDAGSVVRSGLGGKSEERDFCLFRSLLFEGAAAAKLAILARLRTLRIARKANEPPVLGTTNAEGGHASVLEGGKVSGSGR
jgi:hypothetical protein